MNWKDSRVVFVATVKFVAIAFVAVTIACLSTMGPASAGERAAIKAVGVISDVGDTVSLQHIGFMVFSNSVEGVETPEWKIDSFITGEIESALKADYQLHSVTFAKGSIAPSLEPRFLSAPSPEENVRANAKPSDGAALDAYVVVWPRTDNVYPTNQRVQGIGLLTKGSGAWVHAKVVLTLIDAKTSEEIDTCFLRVPNDSTNINQMRPRDDLYVERLDALSGEQKKGFEEGVKALLRDGIAFCLRDLGLTK